MPAERGDRRHVERPALLHHAGHGGADLRAVFDGIEPGSHGVLDADRADGVGGDASVPLVRLVGRGLELLERERREVGTHAGGEHAAGGDDLDGLGAAPHLLANGAADVLRAVDLVGEGPVAVPARDRQCAAGRHDGRPVGRSVVDRRRERTRVAGRSAEIADGGHSVLELAAPVPERLHRGQGVVAGDLQALGLEVPSAVEAQVHVAVDEAGRERPAGAVDVVRRARSTRRAAVGTDPLDPPAGDQHAGAAAHGPPVEQLDAREVRRHVDYALSPAPEPDPPRPAARRNGDAGGR